MCRPQVSWPLRTEKAKCVASLGASTGWMLVVLLALTTVFLDLRMPPARDNCKSLKVANNERCIVCRKPGDALVRKNFGRLCLTAKSRAEQSTSTSDALGCSPCEEPTAPSCSCCSSSFWPAGNSAGASSRTYSSPPLQLLPRSPPLTRAHCLAGHSSNPDRSEASNDQENPHVMAAGSSSEANAPAPDQTMVRAPPHRSVREGAACVAHPQSQR